MPTLTGRQYAAGRKLARRLDLPPDQLFLVLEYGAAAFYGSYAQPKSGGGTRIIHVPHEPLGDNPTSHPEKILQLSSRLAHCPRLCGGARYRVKRFPAS